MSNNHCDFVRLDEVYEIMERMNISQNRVCRILNCSTSTFSLWKRKGKIPAYRLAALKEAILLNQFKKMMKIAIIVYGKDFIEEMLSDE